MKFAVTCRRTREIRRLCSEEKQEVQDRAGTLVEQRKEAFREEKQQVTAAVDAGREAYKQEIAKGKATGG
jgi:hypothetical protein